MRFALPLLMLIAGCSDDRPPAPRPGETAELDDTEAMLDDLAKQEGPEAEAPDPSNNLPRRSD